MTPSKTLFWFCISFILGIFLQSFISIPQTFVWGMLFLATVIIFMYLLSYVFYNFFIFNNKEKRDNFGFIGFCLIFVVLGILRVQISEFYFFNDGLRNFNDNNEKIILQGQIVEEPDIRDKFQKLKIKISLRESLQLQENINSLILVTVGRYPEYSYLDNVKLEGYLKTPALLGDFDYKSYLLKDGIYSVMDFPKVELVSRHHSYNLYTYFYEKVLFFKKELIKSIDSTFSKPQSFIIYGIILGKDKNMPKDLKDQFNATGLSHITAVSGGNIVILMSLLVPLLLFIGLFRSQALYFSITFVWIYILLSGLPISGIRAAIMGSAFLLAEIFGRQNTSSRIIVFTAAMMLIQNPLLLFYDIGFQLSFLASMGIIYLKPIFDSFIKLPKKLYNAENQNFERKSWSEVFKRIIFSRINYLLDIISVTLAAQIFVLPIVIYNFGNISLVSPVTNLLILPIIPWLTLFGFVSALLGTFFSFLGWVFYLPCFVLLSYFLKILEIFSFPSAVKSFTDISLIWVFIYYIIICLFVWYFNKRLKSKFVDY